ncbi:MAG: hypothetical protein AAGB48_06220 [Planctomycetota bacterium]
MTPLRRWMEAVHIVAAGLWAGVVIATGAAAAIIFPTVRGLEPTVGTYPNYSGEHWRLLAGQVAARLFAVGDIVQFICAMLTGVSLAIIALQRDAWASRTIILARLTVYAAVLMLVAYAVLVLGHRMNTNLAEYWAAAKIGDNQTAASARQAFQKDHGPASAVMGSTAAGVFVLTVLGVVGATSRPAAASASPPLQAPPRLETPDLARRASR